MKKTFKLLVFTLFLFLFSGKVYANNIDSIKMDIYLDNNGDAHITEVWDATLTNGTEGYRYYGNLGNSIISNFSVKDETKNYTPYSSNNSWNVNASFDSKAYHYGINNNGSKKELCFGISSYGRHTYTLSYTISGFVGNTSDSQVLYWELIPNELAKQTDDVYVKIHADDKFSDDLDVWGYGNYGGYAYVYDGYIEVSNDNLKSDEYVTVLVKFDSGTFNTTNNIGNDFNYYHNLAEEGAVHYEDKTSTFEVIMNILCFIVPISFWCIIIIVIITSSQNSLNKSGKATLEYGAKGKRIPKDTPMFRDIPCNKDIYFAYWIAKNYNLMKKQTDFLGAVLLKWLKDKKIRVESNTVGRIFKKEETTIVFNNPDMEFDNELETKLYKYMYDASRDGILESREFEKWCSNNYSKILNWFDKVLDYENERLTNIGLLVPYEKTTLKIFKSTIYKVDDKLHDEAVKMKGLYNFFNEFENMTDKEAIEVNFWQEYLMFAQILGLAKKVAKQFKELYPDMVADYTYDSIIFIHTISRSGMSSASGARSRAQSYSSGGGGFSSGGGGGGSFGSGGGGGFR